LGGKLSASVRGKENVDGLGAKKEREQMLRGEDNVTKEGEKSFNIRLWGGMKKHSRNENTSELRRENLFFF